jgi:hypothetical protein
MAYIGSSAPYIGPSVVPSGPNKVFYENGQNVSADYTIPLGSNAMSAGPITIDAGVTVTLSNGSVWSIV